MNGVKSVYVSGQTETSKVMREKMSITIKLGILKLRKSSQIVFLQFAFMKGGLSHCMVWMKIVNHVVSRKQ